MEKYMGEGMYPRYGTHTVAIDLQWEDYKATVHYRLGGNTMGGSVLKDAIESIEERSYSPYRPEDVKHVIFDNDHGEGLVGFILFNANGDDCEFDVDLEDLVVGVRIIAWKPDK